MLGLRDLLQNGRCWGQLDSESCGDISVGNGVFSQIPGMPPAHTGWFTWRFVSLHTGQPADGSFLPEIKSLN